jgi:hypothetical protein
MSSGSALVLVEERRQDEVNGRWLGTCQAGERARADPGRDGPQGADQVGPEHAGLVVALVKRQPRRRLSTGRRASQPLCQEGRLPEPCRRGDERQLRLAHEAQAAAEPRARHHAAPQPRRVELGLEQRACDESLPNRPRGCSSYRERRNDVTWPIQPRRRLRDLLECLPGGRETLRIRLVAYAPDERTCHAIRLEADILLRRQSAQRRPVKCVESTALVSRCGRGKWSSAHTIQLSIRIEPPLAPNVLSVHRATEIAWADGSDDDRRL